MPELEPAKEIRRPTWVPYASLGLIAVQLSGLFVAGVCLVGFLLFPIVIVDVVAFGFVVLLMLSSLASVITLVVAMERRFTYQWTWAMALSAAITLMIVVVLAEDGTEMTFVAGIMYLMAVAGLRVHFFAADRLAAIMDDATWVRYYHARQVCWHCLYSLQGLTGRRCPECGAEIASPLAKSEGAAPRERAVPYSQLPEQKD